MDRILEKLVEAEAGAVVENPNAGGDLNLTPDDMNDVMKVLTGFDDYADAVNEDHATSKGIEESFTTVQEMAKVVDKATLADEKVLELSYRQEEMHRKFQVLSRRINKLRCLSLGTHITEELTTLHDYCGKAAPPLPPPTVAPPPPTFATPRMPTINLGNLRPPLNMPEGVVLPSVPPPPPSVSLPTQPLAPLSTTNSPSTSFHLPLPNAPDLKIKEEIEEQQQQQLLPQNQQKKVLPPSLEEKQKVDEILGQLSSNLKHMVDTYDSEATDSSSGGESCDEAENFSHRNERSAPIKKRARWTWLHNRASIASKWTWLTAQISDLEYRIRQQTDFYRQIRAAKGAVTLGEPTISWPAHARQAVHKPGTEVPLSVKPPTRNYSRVDSTGRKILIKELAPMAISPEEIQAAANQNDDTFTACRTRPIKTLRRRRILGTLGLHRTSNRAAKESTVRCDCIRPGYWCAICFGRSNHIQTPDPVFHDKSRTAALLDHSYHQVLSSKTDIPLDLHMMQMIKNRSWLISGAQAKAKQEAAEEAKKKKKLKKLSKEELLDIKSRKKLKRRESESSAVTKMAKKIKTNRHHPDNKRRKSVTVHHQDGVSMVDIGAVSDDANDGSPLPSPSVSGLSNHEAMVEALRRKRETAFDIDNIVIPYSIAASARVEIIKYKEIDTPRWRVVDEDISVPVPLPASAATPTTPPVKKQKPGRKAKNSKNNKSSEPTLVTAAMAEAAASAATTAAEYNSLHEDITVPVYVLRHNKAEVEERKRWSQPLKVVGMGSGANRNRPRANRLSSQADASSGYNTPDPMSPSQVESVEVATRPSTPDDTTTTPAGTPNNAAGIKGRRRTSSTTIKSRDRNPSASEDAPSSRCTTPGTSESQQPQQQFMTPQLYPWVDPFESRVFPLSEEDYAIMLKEMPTGFEQPQEPMDTTDTASTGEASTSDRLMVATTSTPVAGPSSSSSVHLPSSRRASSQDSSNFDEDAREEEEEEEEDPDWSGDHEDPDDPEWTGGELPGNTSVVLTPAPKNSIRKPPPPSSSKTIHK